MDELYLSPKEAANYLKVTTRTLRRWVVEGKLKAYKAGHRIVRFKKEDLDKVFS